MFDQKKVNEGLNSKMMKEKKNKKQKTTATFERFQDILLNVLDKLTPIKRKTCRYNNTFMGKSLRKTFMNKSI